MSLKKISKFVLISTIASSAATTIYAENPLNLQELQAKAATSYTHITTENVKFRKSAGLNGKLNFVLKKGNKVKVLSTKKVDGIYWSKVQWQDHVGWIAKNYLKKYQATKTATTTTAVKETVSTTANLNMRKSASTKTSILITIPKGTKVTASKITTINNVKWAYVSYKGKKGWVYYAYLKKYQAAATNTITKTTTVKETCATTANVNMRKSASTKTSILATIPKDTKITITKIVTIDNVKWAYGSFNGKNGWISYTYLKKYQTPTQTTTKTTAVKETVSTTANVNMRKSASTQTTVLATIPKGTKVSITKIATINSVKWAYGSYNGKKGWISYAYLKKVSANTSIDKLGSTNSIVIDELTNLYNEPDNESSIIAIIPEGLELEIKETKIIKKMKWAKVQNKYYEGWIVMPALKN